MAFLPHHVVPDSPVNNFAVLNSINQITAGGGISLSSGNLNVDFLANANNASFAVSSIKLPESGLWYFEAIKTAGIYYGAGLHDGTMNNSYILPISWSETSSGIIGILADMDTNTIYSYINGSIVSSNTASIASDLRYFAIGVWSSSGNGRGGCCANFGQDHSFAGNISGGGGYQDGAGLGQFYFDPPTVNGDKALALCSKNIPSGPINVHNDDVPSDYMKAVTWTGQTVGGSMTSWDGTTGTVDVGFQPDLVWIKKRSSSGNNFLADSVTGANKELNTNSTSQQVSNPYGITSFNTNDFNLGHDGGVNGSGDTYVAWCWRAAGSPADGGSSVAGSARIVEEDGTQADTTCDALASDAGASITPSKVSANRLSGFSIAKYSGNSTSGATIPHGLSGLDFLMVKGTKNGPSGDVNWRVYHSDLGGTKNLALNSTSQQISGTNIWNDTNPTSSVITLGNHASTNETGYDYIAYCWHSVEGYSKFGSFIPSNGGLDSSFVDLGFEPAFIMLKQTTGGTWGSYHSWLILDNARNTHNPQTMKNSLWANMSDVEGNRGNGDGSTTDDLIDFLSNGFKVKGDFAEISGGNTGPTIYMAFAKSPFNAPATAR